MPTDTLIALLLFECVASFTPGPNNLTLLASSANFGFRRTMPAILGVTLGYAVLLVAVGLGLGALLLAFPALHAALKIVGCLYILVLAWKIAAVRAFDGPGAEETSPPGFLQMVGFQWVNPKGWVGAVTAFAVFTNPEAPLLSVAIIIGTSILVTFPAVSMWAGFGVALRGFLSDPVRLKWFNIAMGIALAATIWPILMP